MTERRNDGKDGKTERRKDGKTERRKDGKTERRKDGGPQSTTEDVDRCRPYMLFASYRPSVLPSFRPSVLPSFRPPVLPSSRPSVLPSFHYHRHNLPRLGTESDHATLERQLVQHGFIRSRAGRAKGRGTNRPRAPGCGVAHVVAAKDYRATRLGGLHRREDETIALQLDAVPWLANRNGIANPASRQAGECILPQSVHPISAKRALDDRRDDPLAAVGAEALRSRDIGRPAGVTRALRQVIP